MTDARFPAEDPGDPLLRALAGHWDEIRALADPDQLERLAALIAGTAEPDPAEARAALADELLELLPASHPVIRVLRTRPMFTGSLVSPPGPGLPPVTASADASTLPVTIYLSDEEIHSAAEAAVEYLLATAGLRIVGREDPVIGSWFRRMVAGAREAARSTAGQEAALITAHAIQTRLVLDQDAEVTARLLQNVAPVLGALQPTKDAVIRAGALLIVKVDWVVSVFQLTAAQQARLDLHPHFASSPSEIIAALSLGPEDTAGFSGPSQIPGPPTDPPPSGAAEPRNSRPAQDHHYRRARG
jgi:hypothetical protein